MKRLNFINVIKVLFHHCKTAFLALSLTALVLTSCTDSSLKTGYIDINQINKEYKLAIEFEKHIKSIENNAAGELLGLQAEVNLLHDSISSLKSSKVEPNQKLLKDYFGKRNHWEKQKNIELAKVQDSVLFYREELIKDINNRVADFGQENGFHYVFSPSGSGAFMYGDSTLNITKDVIGYLNSK